MKEDKKISKKKITDFDLKSEFCIYCKERFKDLTVYEEDEHEKNCCWHYYLICLSCGNKNNLALLTDQKECKCK